MGSLQALKRMTDALMAIKTARGFDYSCVDKMKVISARDGSYVCEMLVEHSHVNIVGIMHGGCTATIVDTVSSAALVAAPPYNFGVTVDLSISCLNGVKLGEYILIEANNMKVGKKLAFLEVAIRRKSDGVLVATGKQTKFMNQST